MMHRSLLFASLAFTSQCAMAASIYVFATGNAPIDQQVVTALTAEGHDVTLGQGVSGFNNLNVISSFDCVYLQANYNYGFLWNNTQQQAMIDYIRAGGGLVTAEWVLWMAGTSTSYFNLLRSEFPSVEASPWDSRGAVTYTVQTSDPIMSAGVPSPFTTNTTSIAGVYTIVSSIKAGATSFYKEGSTHLVTGWTRGNGRVVNFNTVNGENQLTNLNFRKLLGNSFRWVSSNPPTGPGLTGRLTFNNYVGSPVPTASFYFVDVATGIGSGRVVGNLSSNGAFTIPGPNVPGNYNVYMKSSHWLRKVTTVTTATGQTPNIGVHALQNGDVDGDNEIGPADFTILSSAFGSSLGDPQYQERADLNGDDEVGPADFTILSSGFGDIGD